MNIISKSVLLIALTLVTLNSSAAGIVKHKVEVFNVVQIKNTFGPTLFVDTMSDTSPPFANPENCTAGSRYLAYTSATITDALLAARVAKEPITLLLNGCQGANPLIIGFHF